MLLAVLLLTLFILLILITKVKILLDYFHGNDNDHLTMTFKAWGGLITYKIEVPVIKIDDDSPTLVAETKVKTGKDETVKNEKTEQIDHNDMLNSLRDFKQLLTHIAGLHTIVRKFLKKITVSQVKWHSLVGVGDAAATGVLTGALWAAKGGIIGVLSHYMKLKEMPVMSITPSFQYAVSQTSFSCIFKVRVGHAILAGIKLVKYWKGGWPEFKTKPLSALSGDKTNTI